MEKCLSVVGRTVASRSNFNLTHASQNLNHLIISTMHALLEADYYDFER